MTLPLNFETTFYDLETLITMKDQPSYSACHDIFKKIFTGKVMLGTARLIPLKSNIYVVYDKETCILDDEARADCFSTQKIIKNMAIYNPREPQGSLRDLLEQIRSPSFHASNSVVCVDWIYSAPQSAFFDTVIKLQLLCLEFKKLFPLIVPKVIDISVIYTDSNTKIRIMFEKLAMARIAPEFKYTLRSIDDFNNHIKELKNFLITLYDAELAHGDLTISNLILAKHGGIKSLIDFDTAASLKLIPGRYIKAWASDILQVLNACAFYQNNESKEFYASKIELELTMSEYLQYENTLASLQTLYQEMTEKLDEFRFLSDTAVLDEERLIEFLEMTDPKKIFISFET